MKRILTALVAIWAVLAVAIVGVIVIPLAASLLRDICALALGCVLRPRVRRRRLRGRTR